MKSHLDALRFAKQMEATGPLGQVVAQNVRSAAWTYIAVEVAAILAAVSCVSAVLYLVLT